tara:strand:- start:89728 stop:91017 length:1290 start_codon:yes stop_codon:yes gene_type:complete
MYTQKELNTIYGSEIGLEIEFFSNYNIEDTRKQLSEFLHKKIYFSGRAYNKLQPTSSIFKLKPDLKGGRKMFELVTGPLPFVESKLIISKVFKWIRENGSTNENCAIHVNVSFDKNKVGPVGNVMNLDIGKFVLNFDEDRVYESFPTRKNSVYAKSIKFIFPINGLMQSTEKINWKNYKYVNEKYYGINFASTKDNFLEFRYLGGADYHLKYDNVIEMTEYFILSLYGALENPVYNKNDFKKLDEVLTENKDVLRSYKSFKDFKKVFPNVKLLVNLQTSEQIVEMYYPKIRDRLFSILTLGGMTSGLINYDSDISKIQIKDAKLLKCFELKGFDIVESEIQGNISNCDLFNCKLKNSDLNECNLFNQTETESCVINNSYLSRNTFLKDSFVEGPLTIFSGEMKGGIFKEGKTTKFARFDNTEVVKIQKI